MDRFGLCAMETTAETSMTPTFDILLDAIREYRTDRETLGGHSESSARVVVTAVIAAQPLLEAMRTFILDDDCEHLFSCEQVVPGFDRTDIDPTHVCTCGLVGLRLALLTKQSRSDN